MLLDEAVVYFQRVDVRLHQYWLQTVLRDSQDRGDISVGRHDDLVALVHQSHLHVSPVYQCQRVQPVADTYTVACANIFGIVLFKSSIRLALQIPTRADHLLYSLLYLVSILLIHPF